MSDKDKSIKTAKVVTSYVGTNASASSLSDKLETTPIDANITMAINDQSKDSVVANKGGRPTKYNLGIALTICDRIADGESLVQITRDPSMPKKTAVYEWLLRHQEFAEIYARAREDQADSLADEIQAIADELPMEITDDKGVTRFDSAYVTWQKNRVDARKWIASKLKPKKYSDRLTHQGDKDADAVQVDVNIFDEMIKSLELKRQVK
jgi:hypothetical protein